jgi:DNA topoisomerase-1
MRLRRIDVGRPGFSRRKRGTGFSYLDAGGNVIRDAEVVERIRALAIPPAWQDVWISPYPNGHIQAVGTDEAGRRQYLYHDEWRIAQDEDKHERVRRLARRLPEFRKAVDRDLCSPGLTRDRVLAVALRMLDHGVFRTGNTQYAEEYGSRGAATLLSADVRVKKGLLVFDFTAKGGIRRTIELDDAKLVTAVAALKRSRHDSPLLLVYRDRDGWHDLDAGQINERFHELVGDDYTVKDLRTWTATVHAAVALAHADPPESKKAVTAAVKMMLAEVSEHLGNTPAVARASYVDPRVIAQYEDGRTIARAISLAGSDNLHRSTVRTRLERSVARLLG